MVPCKSCGKPSTHGACCVNCCLEVWDRTKPKTKGNARRVARLIGLRSIGEVKFAGTLERCKVLYVYEADSFAYVPPQQRYTPDFRLKKRSRGGGFMYIEYKGNLTGADRRKLKLVKKQHPDLDLRLVFEKPLNKLNKRSKTTYVEWCEQHGFLWAEKELPVEWLKE